MKKQILLSAVVITLLSACATKGKIEEIEPLGKNQVVEQRVKHVSLVNSLNNAQYFDNIEAENQEQSFHSQIEFLETVLSYGELKDSKNILLLTNYYIASNQLERGIDFYEAL